MDPVDVKVHEETRVMLPLDQSSITFSSCRVMNRGYRYTVEAGHGERIVSRSYHDPGCSLWSWELLDLRENLVFPCVRYVLRDLGCACADHFRPSRVCGC